MSISNEQKAEQLIQQLGFDFSTIDKNSVIQLLKDEIDIYNSSDSSEYIRLLCGYLFCLGDTTDVPLLKKAKYGINMDVGCMIDEDWLVCLENNTEKEKMIADFLHYYKNYFQIQVNSKLATANFQ